MSSQSMSYWSRCVIDDVEPCCRSGASSSSSESNPLASCVLLTTSSNLHAPPFHRMVGARQCCFSSKRAAAICPSSVCDQHRTIIRATVASFTYSDTSRRTAFSHLRRTLISSGVNALPKDQINDFLETVEKYYR